ncbi:MAG: sensor histidine kinase [Erysipelotrichaceae bacterium]|nr:sensor histidine kinase [Erysipelotrichaceae bacterium]MDY5251926.1 sensor histidine kinase [Erysipelotrichaceae bacterium]
MKYLKKQAKTFWCLVLVFLAFNLYFIFLLPATNIQLLIYLDILIIVCLVIFFVIDMLAFYKKEKQLKEYLMLDDFIFPFLEESSQKDIIEHDHAIFQQRLDQQIKINQDLQDFITKWCHEIKIPLTAAMLMGEKIEDTHLNMQLKEQLERIKQALNFVLVSCKVQNTFDDLQVHKIKLIDCINASIKNNRYFLMNDKVKLDIDVHDEMVYSDKTWLVYIIDQLLANAIKYTKDKTYIEIYSQSVETKVYLYIKDHGEGIMEQDLPRIFERGFVGSNHHNGRYKSTGLGLYMVKLMVDKLQHDIKVESEYQNYTCFCLCFDNIENYFNR